MGTKDLSGYRDKLMRDWNELLQEFNSDPFGTQVPDAYKKPYQILYSVFVLGYSLRKVAKLSGNSHELIRKYVNRYISAYEKFELLGELEHTNILKEAFGKKAGRPKKDYGELARTLKKGNPLLWEKLINAISVYRIRGKDEKPIFVSLEKVRRQLCSEIEEFLGVHLNQKDLWGRFIDAVVREEWGAWWKFYSSVLPYKLYMKFVESKRAKHRKLPQALGFAWEYQVDITEIENHYVLACMDTYSGLILGYRIKEKEKGKSYNDAFDRYDVGIFLKEVFERWGIPKGLKIDNGKNFIAQYVQEALNLLGVEVFRTQAYASWQKQIERAFGEIKDWLLSPSAREFEGKQKIGKAIELYNAQKQTQFKNNFARKENEEKLSFAFYHKERRKVVKGYVSVAGVKFFVGHLLENDTKLLGRGKKKEVNEVLVAVDPQNLTKAFVYVPSSEGLIWDGQSWKFLGAVSADSVLPADERTLTGKAVKQRKQRTLKKKAEKLYKRLSKVQKELTEQKPPKDPFDELIEFLDSPKKERLTLPSFDGAGSVLIWVKKNEERLSELPEKEKEKLVRIIERASEVLPLSEKAYLSEVAKKLQKEVWIDA